MIYYEIDYNNTDGSADQYVATQLNLSTFFSITLGILVNFRFYIELKWKKSKNYVTQKDTLWTAGMVKWMIIETLFSCLTPQSIFKDLYITEDNKDLGITYKYPLNHLFWSLIILKGYTVIRTVFLTNIFSKPRSQRVWAMTGCYADFEFSVKAQFKASPSISLIVTTLVSVFSWAQMLRIYERPLSDFTGQNFNMFPTSLWNIIVTMATVGYGDVYPKSKFGRLLGSFWCVWGVILTSMMVVTLSETLNFSDPQRNSFHLLQRLYYRDELQVRAAKALKSMFLYKKKNKVKNLFYATKKINLEQRTMKLEKHFKRQMFKFKKKESEMRKFNIATEVSYLSKKIFDLQEIFDEIEDNNKVFKQIQNECIEKLQDFFNSRASESAKAEYQNECEVEETQKRRLSIQNLFESQLGISKNNSYEREEDKEAHVMNSEDERKFL